MLMIRTEGGLQEILGFVMNSPFIHYFVRLRLILKLKGPLSELTERLFC